MLCAHCYADRLGLTKLVGRKGADRPTPKPLPKTLRSQTN
jgi:hypothetical protein